MIESAIRRALGARHWHWCSGYFSDLCSTPRAVYEYGKRGVVESRNRQGDEGDGGTINFHIFCFPGSAFMHI